MACTPPLCNGTGGCESCSCGCCPPNPCYSSWTYTYQCGTAYSDWTGGNPNQGCQACSGTGNCCSPHITSSTTLYLNFLGYSYANTSSTANSWTWQGPIHGCSNWTITKPSIMTFILTCNNNNWSMSVTGNFGCNMTNTTATLVACNPFQINCTGTIATANTCSCQGSQTFTVTDTTIAPPFMKPLGESEYVFALSSTPCVNQIISLTFNGCCLQQSGTSGNSFIAVGSGTASVTTTGSITCGTITTTLTNTTTSNSSTGSSPSLSLNNCDALTVTVNLPTPSSSCTCCLGSSVGTSYYGGAGLIAKHKNLITGVEKHYVNRQAVIDRIKNKIKLKRIS